MKNWIGVVVIALLMALTEQAMAQTITWTNPTEREDGTPLALTEIGGYRIYWGSASGDLQQTIVVNGQRTAHTVDFPPGKSYFQMTVVDTAGRESLPTPELVAEVPIYDPKPVTNMQFSLD